MTKKERIYVAAQFLISITGTSIFQMTYNEPAFLLNKTGKEIATLAVAVLILALCNTFVTWLSYLSDPKEHIKSLLNPPPKKEDVTKGGSDVSTGT